MKTNVPSINARPFFDVAREIRRGNFLSECSDELQNVVQAVDETGKPAKLIIELTVSPAARVGGAVKVADKIITKLPTLPAGETMKRGMFKAMQAKNYVSAMCFLKEYVVEIERRIKDRAETESC